MVTSHNYQSELLLATKHLQIFITSLYTQCSNNGK